jgi:hypothetical protein
LVNMYARMGYALLGMLGYGRSVPHLCVCGVVVVVVVEVVVVVVEGSGGVVVITYENRP